MVVVRGGSEARSTTPRTLVPPRADRAYDAGLCSLTANSVVLFEHFCAVEDKGGLLLDEAWIRAS